MHLLPLFFILCLCGSPFALSLNIPVVKRTDSANSTAQFLNVSKDGTNPDPENYPLNAPRAVHTHSTAKVTDSRDVKYKPVPSKREQQYAKQPNLDIDMYCPTDELIILSTPKNEDWRCRDDYIYAKEAGSGIYIYHIEFGILPGYDEEFDNRVESPLLPFGYDTSRSINELVPPDGHSTCVADRAMGKEYGAAKKAKLVPVTLMYGYEKRPDAEEPQRVILFADGFKSVINDIENNEGKKNPDRYKKSIVMIALGDAPKDFSEKLSAPIKDHISKLFDLGVPVIAAAGNDAARSINTDFYPQLLESESYPLINVGNMDNDGSINIDAQRGPQVAVFAPGEAGLCVGPGSGLTGASMAVPLVAGSIAVFMSQNEGPFYDKTHAKAGTRDFVFAVRDFIKKEASYLNAKGVRQFWNMAPKLDNSDGETECEESPARS